jgi:choline kinase
MNHSSTHSNRTGVILAAGFGSRLKGTVSSTDLKPLTPVAGQPLIYRTIESLGKAGCTRVIIVLGFAFDEIKKDIVSTYSGDIEVEFVKNDKYDLGNGISVLSAKDKLPKDGDFILTMADHILSDGMMKIAANHTPPDQGASLLVDYKIDTILDMDDATKVLEEDGKIKQIDKQLTDFNCIDTGVFVCTKALLDAIQETFNKKGDASLSDGVKQLADRGKMTVVDIKEHFWQDVDTPEMLEYAEEYLQKEG